MKFERCLDSESEYSTIYGSMSAISVNFGRGLYRGILVMWEYVLLIIFSMKHEFRKLFFVVHDLKVLRDPMFVISPLDPTLF